MVLGEKRALVVDDDPVVRRLTVRALTNERFICKEAGEGREASVRASTHDFDLVVTDLRMPNRNGHALAIELLTLPTPPMVVVLTGVIEPRLARDLLRRGVAQIEYKPVDYPTFAIKMRSLTERPLQEQVTEGQFVWHTITSAADFVGVCPQTLGKWVKNQLLSTFGQKGRNLRFSTRELEHKQQAVMASKIRLNSRSADSEEYDNENRGTVREH